MLAEPVRVLLSLNSNEELNPSTLGINLKSHSFSVPNPFDCKIVCVDFGVVCLYTNSIVLALALS